PTPSPRPYTTLFRSDQWRILRGTFDGHHIDEHAIFSWIPTLTQIGRQAIFSGRIPMEFATSIEGTDREPVHWSNFWQDRGLPKRDRQSTRLNSSHVK